MIDNELLASMESQLNILKEIRKTNTPFNVSHLNLLKQGLPSVDTSEFLDLQSSMEGLFSTIKNKLFGIKSIDDFKKANKDQTNPKVTLAKAIEFSKTTTGVTGSSKVELKRYNSKYLDKYLLSIVEGVELDTKSCNKLNDKKYRSLFKGLLDSMVSHAEVEELLNNSTDDSYVKMWHKSEESMEKINKVIKSNYQLFKNFPLFNNKSFKLNIKDQIVKNESLKLSYTYFAIDIEYDGHNKKYAMDMSDPVEGILTNVTKEQFISLADNYKNILDFYTYLSDLLNGYDWEQTAYGTEDQVWWIWQLSGYIWSLVTDIEGILVAAMSMKPMVDASTESDILIEGCPIKRIEQCLLNRVPLTDSPLDVDVSSLTAVSNKTCNDLLVTAMSALPIYHELIKGTKQFIEIINKHTELGVGIDNIPLSNLFIKINDPDKCMPPFLPGNLTLTISGNHFENEGINRIQVSAIKGVNQHIEVNAIPIDIINYILRNIKDLQRLHNGEGFTTGNKEQDEFYLTDTNRMVSYIYGTFIPRVLEWMTKSFGV